MMRRFSIDQRKMFEYLYMSVIREIRGYILYNTINMIIIFILKLFSFITVSKFQCISSLLLNGLMFFFLQHVEYYRHVFLLFLSSFVRQPILFPSSIVHLLLHIQNPHTHTQKASYFTLYSFTQHKSLHSDDVQLFY